MDKFPSCVLSARVSGYVSSNPKMEENHEAQEDIFPLKSAIFQHFNFKNFLKSLYVNI